MKFIDFFAGVGGMRMGLERSGHTCVGFCEWEKFARQSYKAIYNTEGGWENHDIRTVNANELPRAELWCFGFPCQDISVAGKMQGILKGERSNLFFEIIRLLRETAQENRPKFLLAENVKNLLSVGRGWDFARCISALGEVGYDVEWQLFNTKYSYRLETKDGIRIVRGIPQNRERVFMLGRLVGATGGRKIFPIQRADKEDFVKLSQIGHQKEGCTHSQKYRVYDTNGLAPSMCAGMGEGGNTQPMVIEDELKMKRLGNVYGDQFGTGFGGNVWAKEGLAPTLKTTSAASQQFVIADEPIKRLGSYRPSGHNATSVVDSSGIAPTVMENHGQVTATIVKDEPEVIGGVGEPNEFGKQFRQGNRIYSAEAVSPALQTNNGNASGGSVLIEHPTVYGSTQEHAAIKKDGVCPTLCSQMGTSGGNTPMVEVRAVLTPDREEKRQNGRRMKDDGEPMFTLTSQDRHGVAINEDSSNTLF